jgi:hypothetical protein
MGVRHEFTKFNLYGLISMRPKKKEGGGSVNVNYSKTEPLWD